jgi:hypothetical protein
MAVRVDTQIATQAANRLLSSRVSNFMMVLLGSMVLLINQASMAARVDTQIATQAAKKLLSIRVSNFMAVLRGISGCGFHWIYGKARANRAGLLKAAFQSHLWLFTANAVLVRGQLSALSGQHPDRRNVGI